MFWGETWQDDRSQIMIYYANEAPTVSGSFIVDIKSEKIVCFCSVYVYQSISQCVVV